jgi:hypothetical protein
MVVEKSKYDLIKLNTQKLFDIGAKNLRKQPYNSTCFLSSFSNKSHGSFANYTIHPACNMNVFFSFYLFMVLY